MQIAPSDPATSAPFTPGLAWILHAHRATARAAVLALARTRTLLGARGQFRINWSDRSEIPIAEQTMRSLERRGMVSITNNQTGFNTARLTRAGESVAAALQAAKP